MARLFLAPERLVGDRVTVDGEPHRYLSRVLRLRAEDPLTVFDGQGTEIEARLLAVGPRSTEIALGRRRAVASASGAITLLQAVPRHDRMDLVVQKTTELGVLRIVPVLAGRAVARPPASRSERWRAIAREAARQSGRADVPTIEEPTPLREVLEDPSLPQARLVLFEAERARGLRRALEGGPSAVALLVGPEGGFAPEEVAAAEGRGFVPVTLGPRILRTETAAIVAVALAQAAAGGLD